MKKILLGLCALSVISTSAFATYFEGNVGTGIDIPIRGTLTVENNAVIPGEKIVIYKEGPDSVGATGIDFTYKVQKGTALTEAMTEQSYFVKSVPVSGATEADIRGDRYHVQKTKIQVGVVNGTGAITTYNPITNANLSWTLSALLGSGGDKSGTIALKSKYDDTGKKVKVYLDGTAGQTAGALTMNAKFAIKVIN